MANCKCGGLPVENRCNIPGFTYQEVPPYRLAPNGWLLHSARTFRYDNRLQGGHAVYTCECGCNLEADDDEYSLYGCIGIFISNRTELEAVGEGIQVATSVGDFNSPTVPPCVGINSSCNIGNQLTDWNIVPTTNLAPVDTIIDCPHPNSLIQTQPYSPSLGCMSEGFIAIRNEFSTNLAVDAVPYFRCYDTAKPMVLMPALEDIHPVNTVCLGVSNRWTTNPTLVPDVSSYIPALNINYIDLSYLLTYTSLTCTPPCTDNLTIVVPFEGTKLECGYDYKWDITIVKDYSSLLLPNTFLPITPIGSNIQGTTGFVGLTNTLTTSSDTVPNPATDTFALHFNIPTGLGEAEMSEFWQDMDDGFLYVEIKLKVKNECSGTEFDINPTLNPPSFIRLPLLPFN